MESVIKARIYVACGNKFASRLLYRVLFSLGIPRRCEKRVTRPLPRMAFSVSFYRLLLCCFRMTNEKKKKCTLPTFVVIRD